MNREKDILQKLHVHKDPVRAKHHASYMNTHLSLLGCKMPAIRQVAAQLEDSFERTDVHDTW